MGKWINTYEDLLLDHVLKVTPLTQPMALTLALSTADPGEDGSGLAEPSGNGYSRATINNWDAASARATENTDDVSFAQATGSWGVISHWCIFDNSGNKVCYGEFTESKTVVSGNILTVSAGECDISWDSGGISTDLANKLLDHVFINTEYSVPTNIYVAFSTANPADDGSGLAEPSGNNYSRQVANSWSASSGGAASNSAAITCPTASGSWGTITHAALYDASTGGNMLFYSTISPSQAVGNGDYFEYSVGNFDITVD